MYAFYDQFFQHDLPCPLCLLQRAGFVACMIALLLNITYGAKLWHYGLLLVSGFFGAAVALRQVSLHVIPGRAPYGEDFLGWHFYTWSFIAFVCVILLTSLLLLIPEQYSDKAGFVEYAHQPVWVKVIIAIGLLIILGNSGAALVECGFGVCDENSEAYKLLLPIR